jgi:hypothetical protein
MILSDPRLRECDGFTTIWGWNSAQRDGWRIATLNLPARVAQEVGYAVVALGTDVVELLCGLLGILQGGPTVCLAHTTQRTAHLSAPAIERCADELGQVGPGKRLGQEGDADFHPGILRHSILGIARHVNNLQVGVVPH